MNKCPPPAYLYHRQHTINTFHTLSVWWWCWRHTPSKQAGWGRSAQRVMGPAGEGEVALIIANRCDWQPVSEGSGTSFSALQPPQVPAPSGHSHSSVPSGSPRRPGELRTSLFQAAAPFTPPTLLALRRPAPCVTPTVQTITTVTILLYNCCCCYFFCRYYYCCWCGSSYSSCWSV